MGFSTVEHIVKPVSFNGRRPQMLDSTVEGDEIGARILGEQFPMFKQYRTGSPEDKQIAREKIFMENKGLAYKEASRKYRSLAPYIQPLSFEDLFQEASIGILRAIETYDYTRGVRFSVYANFWIKAKITKYFLLVADLKPRERKFQFKRVTTELTQILGHFPSRYEIAEFTNMSLAEVDGQMSLARPRKLISLQSPSFEDGGRSLEETMPDTLVVHPLSMLFNSELQIVIEEILAESSINSRDLMYLKLYFGFEQDRPMTISEISCQCGVREEKVRQHLKRSIRSLRKKDTMDKLNIFV